MSEQWLGLHNPERHEPYAGQFAGYAECLPVLGGCLAECGEDDPCRCCLAAEVETLRAQVKAVRMTRQTLFWKATRPDGTDFYTGAVDYAGALESGEPLPELAGGAFPGAGWYHAGVHPTSCAGMQWPCRLFIVEPVGEVMWDGVPRVKVGARSLRVVEERPAHEALGPQGERIAALIGRAGRLTMDEARRLAAAWDAAGYAAWDAAWAAARDAAGDAAGYAAWASAWALVVRDLIDPAHYAVLTMPWASVIGPVHPDDPEVTA